PPAPLIVHYTLSHYYVKNQQFGLPAHRCPPRTEKGQRSVLGQKNQPARTVAGRTENPREQLENPKGGRNRPHPFQRFFILRPGIGPYAYRGGNTYPVSGLRTGRGFVL